VDLTSSTKQAEAVQILLMLLLEKKNNNVGGYIRFPSQAT
jgi:hypothetical protein